MSTARSARSLALLLVMVVVYAFVWTQRDRIMDWFSLRSYTAPSTVAALADRDTMTDRGRHYFYINHPQVSDRQIFNQHCANKTEQADILGCFLGDRQGIYIFNVTATELNGVQEVTAAHEMLHQAYTRLSSSERSRVDAMLDDYYSHSLTDESIKSQIDIYKKSEPTELHNEMHSLFGSEVVSLPQPLEAYYKQYFGNRSKIGKYYQAYQAAFTERKAQIATYDELLAAQKPQIDSLQKTVENERAQIDSVKLQLDSARKLNKIALYNSLVGPYNDAVDLYNADLDRLKGMVTTYNDIVSKRNAIADQERALAQNLSSTGQSLQTTGQE